MAKMVKGSGDVERRHYRCEGLEVRAAEDEPTRLVGYAAMFGELSEDLGGFRERVAPGAFSKGLGAADVRALFNHDETLILGRTKAKTLSIAEDERGLRVEVTPPDTQAARDVIESVRRGDVDQMSFGFRTIKDDWEEVDGELIRTLVEVRLFDVSPVVFPAYPQTDIAVRSMDAWKAESDGGDDDGGAPDYSIEKRKLDLMALS